MTTIWILCSPAAIALVTRPDFRGGHPARGFVYLRDVDPSIRQDMKYAVSDNFVGKPLPGYDAAECVLRRAAPKP